MMTTRCHEGRLLRYQPTSRWSIDPPDEMDIGPCPECNGIGCEELPTIEAQAERAKAIFRGAAG